MNDGAHQRKEALYCLLGGIQGFSDYFGYIEEFISAIGVSPICLAEMFEYYYMSVNLCERKAWLVPLEQPLVACNYSQTVATSSDHIYTYISLAGYCFSPTIGIVYISFENCPATIAEF